MKVSVISETDYLPAFFGLGLSYGLTSDLDYFEFVDSEEKEKLRVQLHKIADKLAPRDTGENKFLESIVVWLDITAPRFWWAEMDTYRIGCSKQSESTIHTITKRHLTQEDFEYLIPTSLLDLINSKIDTKDLVAVKNILPEGFLQRRIVCTNYKALRHIFQQRKNHKLPQWEYFLSQIIEQINYSNYLGDDYE